MEAELISKGGIIIPEGVNLSGHVYVQAAMDVFEGGRWERDSKKGLVNIGGRKVGEYVGPAKSFMRSWTQFFRMLFYVPSDVPDQYTDDGGVNRLLAILANGVGAGQGMVAAAADFAFGTGVTAVAANQFNLATPALGPTPGITPTVLQEDNVARVFKVEATILNGGLPVTISEVGLFGNWRQQDLAGQTRRTMLMRDLVSPTVLVGTGQTALGRYTFTAAI